MYPLFWSEKNRSKLGRKTRRKILVTKYNELNELNNNKRRWMNAEKTLGPLD